MLRLWSGIGISALLTRVVRGTVRRLSKESSDRRDSLLDGATLDLCESSSDSAQPRLLTAWVVAVLRQV